MQMSCKYVPGFKRPSMFIFWMHISTVFQSNVMTNRAMKRLVFLLNMVPRYGIDDTIQCVTFVYILMSIFLSSAVFIKLKSQIITTARYTFIVRKVSL